MKAIGNVCPAGPDHRENRAELLTGSIPLSPRNIIGVKVAIIRL
jgi:hypothetical protein